MHKSVSILSIVLLALSLMTFGNIFPQTMAIEQDGEYYETGQTIDYVNQTTDYVEDKHQPYSSDNNYVKSQNSDLVKKIKCNNINANLNGLNLNTLPGSTTAEDIGTQALEENDGASANSFGNGYERNNGNFDLNCINNNDNQGGPGQVGPQGPVGPEGPSGITQLNEGTNVYQVTAQANNSPQGSPPEKPINLSVQAKCDPGDFVINGGYNIRGPANILTLNLINQPITSPPGSGWDVLQYAFDAPASTVIVTVNAYCFDNPPAHIP